MKLLIDNDQYYSSLNDILDLKPVSVSVISYGLWAGILPDGRDVTEWGEKYKSKTHDLLHRMSQIENARVIVGSYEHKNCNKTVCEHCEKKTALDLIRHLNHAQKFDTIDWKLTFKVHAKFMVFGFGNDRYMSIIGSRNLSDSSWVDIVVMTSQLNIAQGLLAKFENVWESSRVLTPDTLSDVFVEIGLQSDTINSLGA